MPPSVEGAAAAPAVDAGTLEWAMTKLATAFPASFPTEEKTEGVSVLWRELLDQHPWISREVFATAVYHIAWHHKDDYLPGPAVALDHFREAQRKVGEAQARTDLERLEERQQAVRALPASSTGRWADRPGPEKAAFLLRHLAIGKLRAREAAEPTEDQLGEVMDELRRSGFLRRALERIAAGEDVSPADFARAAGAPGGRR